MQNRNFSHANKQQQKTAPAVPKIFIGRVTQKDFQNGSFMIQLALGPDDLAKLEKFLADKPEGTDWTKVWVNFDIKMSKDKGTWYCEMK